MLGNSRIRTDLALEATESFGEKTEGATARAIVVVPPSEN